MTTQPAPMAPPGLRITTDLQVPTLRVRLAGELDIACAGLIDGLIDELPGIDAVTIDLSDLEFTDSAGIHALVALRRACEAGDRQIVLLNARPIVRRVFEAFGVPDCLDG